jgi:hypothetical protein
VVFSQNHDQVGNRVLGERTSALLPFEALRLLAASVLLSPYVPLLFMGEEYGEPSPFQYFVSHSDPELVEAVRQGRRREFEAFAWKADPPDPQDPATRNAGVLRWELRSEGRHRRLLELYTELLALRRRHPALGTLPSAGGRTNGDAAGGPTGGDSEPSGSSAALFKVEAAVPAEAKVLVLHRRSSPGETVREDAASGDGRQGSPPGDGLLASEPPVGPPVGRPGSEALAILSFSSEKQAVKIAVPEGEWRLLLDSEEDRWGGRGSRLPTTITAAGELPLPLDLSGYAFAVYASLPKDEP